jgi:hypothetical protein
MSRYFVTDPPVAVPEFDVSEVLSDVPPNVIYIKAKMDVATDAKVKSELVKMAGDNKTMEMHLGENQLALLIHNIVRWEGPDLGAVPCTPELIRKLDPTEPHIVLVLDEIARRNKRPDGPKKTSAAASTSARNGAAGWRESANGDGANSPDQPSLSLQLATGTRTSPLQSAIIGRQKASDD